MWSKSFFFTFILILLISCKNTTNNQHISSKKEVNSEKILPAVKQFEDLEGKPVAISDYRGKRVLLNFWATWCRPCIEEMPALLRAQEILKKEGYVFLLASDQSVKIIKGFEAKKGFDFTFIKYNGSWAEHQIDALPTTFIYNEAGEKIEKIVGEVVWDSPEVLQRLKDTY